MYEPRVSDSEFLVPVATVLFPNFASIPAKPAGSYFSMPSGISFELNRLCPQMLMELVLALTGIPCRLAEFINP
jgi:hypothetical protein